MRMHLGRKWKQTVLLPCLLIGLSSPSFAVERNLPEELKAIVSVCTSGFSASSKGELEAGIVRFLSNQIEAKGELMINSGGMKELLDQFTDEKLKIEASKIFTGCVVDTVDKIYSFRETQKIPKTQHSDKILVPEAETIVEPGQTFALTVGRSASLVNSRAFIAITGDRYEGTVPLVTFTEETKSLKVQPTIGEKIMFRDKSCWVTYYAMDAGKKVYSFKLQCKK